MPSQQRAVVLRDRRTEKQVEAAGDRAMRLLGFAAIRFSQPRATMQTSGIPDRRYYHGGRKLALWWEAKKAGGRQSPSQIVFQAVAESCGELYCVGTDDDLARFVTALLHRYPNL